MKTKLYILYILTFFTLSSAVAQEDKVTFSVKLSKEKLGLNERLKVEFTTNKQGDNFVAPNFNGFTVLMGPATSISRSWNNGKRKFSLSYSYILQPTTKGSITIDPAKITIDDQEYKSDAKTITVTDAVVNPNAPPSANDIAQENLHLVAEISKPNPYLNEAITVVYKMYVSPSIEVSGFQAVDNPKYNNFWSQDIPVKRYTTKDDTYKGEEYRSVILKRVVLYPQKTGKLTLEPLSLDVGVQVPTQRRDFFGGPIYAQANLRVSAGNRYINVKPLPEEGKPASFTGAVGNFNFLVTTSKTHLNASESLQAKVEINGKGNLKLFDIPTLNLPGSLEVYDPEHDEKVTTSYTGMEGKISDSYTIVPEYRGKYPIPSIAFSYFNPKTKKYHTLNSEELVINVVEGPTNTEDTAAKNANATTKQVVETKGKQFNFIKTQTTLKPISNTYFFKSTAYYLWLLLPILLIPIAILLGRKREAMASDVVGNKVRKANKLARKYLSAAKKTLGKKEAFYVALEKALHNYLKAKLKIETSDFSKDKITDLLNQKGIEQSTIDGFISLLKNCEMARYSPFSNVQMQQDYNKASEVISQMDKQL
ncbi:aerotolerance-related exported protein [Cellulophaga geojensis KL-A]|uniref:Aerotolerance-related exported protein n=1 Tax=Cellulophaga geojensis KL-A TaxID=1328323 RepID=A0ABN0RN43_9FLAO|nr:MULTISPECIES: BatD family protein [Cellulophaga]AIM60020.1 BatD protein [Cellulophaga lytica]EWH13349.1 aerotolerance-related exported protein [Cellulophaga geojensis KL-A]